MQLVDFKNSKQKVFWEIGVEEVGFEVFPE